MSLGKLDHYSIRTTKLAETERFYTDVLGLQAGPRPEFKFPGIWLYNAGHAVVHVVGIDRANPQPLIDLSRREGAGGCRRHRQHRSHRFCRRGSGRHEGPLQRRRLCLPRKTGAQPEPGAAFPGRPERRHDRAELPRLRRHAWRAGERADHARDWMQRRQDRRQAKSGDNDPERTISPSQESSHSSKETHSGTAGTRQEASLGKDFRCRYL